MNSIKLPVLHQNDETTLKESNGLPTELTEYDVFPVYFFSFESFSRYYDGERQDEKTHCSLFSGGREYVINMPFEELKPLLDRL